ncbi:MAG: flagellar hook-basal body complex protein FliE [Candidatus Sericytochromatia bacterium]
MINNVSSVRLNPVGDPFEAFSVEFGEMLQAPVQGIEGVERANFGEVLNQALQEVNTAQYESSGLTFDFATGKPVDIHTVMIAAAKADVLLQLTSAVVSKTAAGVNQLLNTQV